VSDAEQPLGAAVTGRLSLLAASLRASGARVGLGELLVAHRALGAVDPSSRSDAYHAVRAALCSRRQDLGAFDAAWEAVFGQEAETGMPHDFDDPIKIALPQIPSPDAAGRERRGEAPFGERPLPVAASQVELLLDRDFGDYTDAERALARRLVGRIAARGPLRMSRRTRASRRRGDVHDLRRTLRASLRYGGEPIERRFRAPTLRPRSLVLVCDVSGSMAAYSRMLLQYLHASVAARRRVEAFVFGTRLTRVTRELAGRDHDRALERAAAAVSDWSGGTRIGDALAELNRAHGRRVGRGAVVVVLSDGWDLGDPDVLAGEMARLARTAHSLVWLNPLKARPGYEPLTRGMTAALPYLDHFMAGNSIRSLGELAELLEGGMR